ncbi:MAG TPA: MFS transporter, partial [Caldilineaceae bacterium]|nr:MFS transporter [Caldilineaceae bacterium]
MTATTDETGSKTHQSWVLVLILFGVTSIVEGVAVSQLFAFLPLYLAEMQMAASDIPRWVGWLTSLIFLLGLPLVPLWGVWADKYSRKTVIIRSALVEAVVFALIAASRQPWHLAVGMLLSGFQLGNSGVMLGALRDVTPRSRLGIAIALFGATGVIGFALGPVLGSLLIDRFGTSISTVFLVSGLLSLAVALMLAVGFREVSPEARPEGPVLKLAFGAMRSVFTEPVTRRLFAIFGVAFLARFMISPYLPILTERIHASGEGVASAIALVVGTAALVGGLISPLAGAAGDRFGFRTVLVASLAAYGLTLLLMPFAPSVLLLALLSALGAAFVAGVNAMVLGLLSMDVPPQQRSATLNLVYLPLYLAGIVGPAIGALVVSAGLATVFVLSAVIVAGGALYVFLRLQRPAEANA